MVSPSNGAMPVEFWSASIPWPCPQGQETDAFGIRPEMREVLRVPLQLQMQANKIAKKLFDRHCQEYAQQTTFHVQRGLQLNGFEDLVSKFRHLLAITCDGAADNRGEFQR